MAGYVYASAGFGESSTDLVFAGNGIIAENGTLLEESPRFTMQEQLVISEIDIENLQNLVAGDIQGIECHDGYQQCQCGIESAGDTDYRCPGVRVDDTFCQSGYLYRNDRPHLHQRLRPYPFTGCHTKGNLHQGCLPPAFQRYQSQPIGS